jgi:hypothetical protein
MLDLVDETGREESPDHFGGVGDTLFVDLISFCRSDILKNYCPWTPIWAASTEAKTDVHWSMMGEPVDRRDSTVASE